MDITTILSGMFQDGGLDMTLPGGGLKRFGDGTQPKVAVRIADRLTLARIVTSPALGAGEAYMDGRLVMDRGTVHDLIDVAVRNMAKRPVGKQPGAVRRWWTKQRKERNERIAAKRNVAHHYDLSVDFYRLFLDSDLQYSCAYFETPDASLETAQVAKIRHLAAKLAVSSEARVLDIGCGWGGTALALARWTGARVHGVTLSGEQLQTARARAAAAGLADRVTFSLTDYRDLNERFDRVISVGMFEHVGRPNYQTFFDKVADLLTDDGVAVIHSIGRCAPSTTDPFTAKYIFPGGYIPALSEVLPSAERARLRVTDIEILRLHYAETLRCWRERFAANRQKALALYDERFCRMWEFYLSGAEAGFRHGDHMNFQIQLSKKVDTLPLTRGYIEAAERDLARL